nr:copper resistance CopC family protein [Mycobacterium botniense]
MRMVAVAVLVTALLVSSSALAAAHATRVAADPPENAAVTTSPARVTATFNEELQSGFAAMTVVGPDGNIWSTGQPQVRGATVSIALRPLGPVGPYTVNYRVTSADGHVVAGSWSFRLTVPGTGRPGPPTFPTHPGDGVPLWPFVAATLAVVGGAALWAVRRQFWR